MMLDAREAAVGRHPELGQLFGHAVDLAGQLGMVFVDQLPERQVSSRKYVDRLPEGQVSVGQDAELAADFFEQDLEAGAFVTHDR